MTIYVIAPPSDCSGKALHVHQSAVRGEIDNHLRGRVEGWITLVGFELLVMLGLTDKCLAISAFSAF
jgi:hypothetical protein